MINKIVHITLGKANPNRMNGVNKVVNSLATYQSKEGLDVEVWGITNTPEEDHFKREYTLRLFKNEGKFKLDKSLKKEIADQNKQTRFHIHGSFNLELYLIAKFLSKHNFKYIYTSHGAFNEIAMQRSYLKKRIYTFLFEKSIVKNAYKMHFIGASEIDGAKKVFQLNDDYFLVPNGQEKINESNNKTKTTEQKTVFGFIGRLDVHTKGLDILMEAIKGLSDTERSKMELWIIGGGNGEEYMKSEISKNNLADVVKMLGPKFAEEKNDLIKQMDFLCLNSRNEGMPGVVLESLSFGVPVIISQETNLGQEVKEFKAGFVLERNEAVTLRANLINALNITSEDYSSMSQNAQDSVDKVFDWSIIAKRMISNYA